jgi:hypothetical protein
VDCCPRSRTRRAPDPSCSATSWRDPGRRQKCGERTFLNVDPEESHHDPGIGAGTGLFLGRLMECPSPRAPILCVDPSAEMLRQLRRDAGPVPAAAAGLRRPLRVHLRRPVIPPAGQEPASAWGGLVVSEIGSRPACASCPQADWARSATLNFGGAIGLSFRTWLPRTVRPKPEAAARAAPTAHVPARSSRLPHVTSESRVPRHYRRTSAVRCRKLRRM